MSADDLSRFALDNTLAGNSEVLQKKAMHRIYGDKAHDIVEGMKKSPSIAVPVEGEREAGGVGGGPAVLQQDLERPAREVLPQVPEPPGHQFQGGQLCYRYIYYSILDILTVVFSYTRAVYDIQRLLFKHAQIH